MNMKKVKTYNIMLSRVFPVTHPKAGQDTDFPLKLERAMDCSRCELSGWAGDIKSTDYLKCDNPCFDGYLKLHTIRANYDLWKKRIDEVMAGEAELCLRQWTGKPYRSKTVVIKRLRWYDGVGIQKLTFPFGTLSELYIEDQKRCCVFSGIEKTLANNDGLSLDDWQAWFAGYDHSKPLAIIHFTNFRY